MAKEHKKSHISLVEAFPIQTPAVCKPTPIIRELVTAHFEFIFIDSILKMVSWEILFKLPSHSKLFTSEHVSSSKLRF